MSHNKSTLWKPQITPTSPPMVPIPKQINPDHTLIYHLFKIISVKVGIMLALVAHKATSNHPPFIFSFLPQACYDTAWLANRRESICAGCSRQFLLRSEISFPVCQRSILTIVPYSAWGAQVSSRFFYWTTVVKPTCQYKKNITQRSC